ncbi:MAG: DUF4058 family protein [Pirellulales bacterium]|nr:DUF4058 family protein [Pirellulales bacterium]
MEIDDRIEQFGLWSVFHKHLILEWFAVLRDELGGDYWVDMENEILLVPRPSGPARPVAADVDVTRRAPPGSAAAGVFVVTPPRVEVDEPIGEFEQSWIEIRRRDWPDPRDPLGARVVAVLELVSPSNKGSYGKGDLRKFLAKRQDYLLSTVSYTEIDLLRQGVREVPSAVENVAEHAWIAWSTQVQEHSRRFWAWGWDQGEKSPTIVFPLDFPYTHSLDLAATYERAYHINRWPHRLQPFELRKPGQPEPTKG